MLIERDERITGVFRRQSVDPIAPPEFATNSALKGAKVRVARLGLRRLCSLSRTDRSTPPLCAADAFASSCPAPMYSRLHVAVTSKLGRGQALRDFASMS